MTLRLWTPQQRLQRLVDLYGPGEGLAKLVGDAAPAGGLPEWLIGDAGKAEMVVDHLLNVESLHLPWELAPFWKDDEHDEHWPLVGSSGESRLEPGDSGGAARHGPGPHGGTSHGQGGADAWLGVPDVGVSAGSAQGGVPAYAAAAAQPAATSAASKEATAYIEKAQAAPLAVIWSELVTRGKGTAWLPWYRSYFMPTFGAPALLEGVFKQAEFDHAGTMSLLAEQGRVANAFAATVAIAIATLESVDFNAVHAAPTKGYPSQWTCPNPSVAQWKSPLHSDHRFWDEFDEPPAKEPKRFIYFGLSTVEAARVWGRRVAINLWCDVHEMWPSRLDDMSLAHKRMLLGWDPNDPKAADPSLCWRFGDADVVGRGYSAVRPSTPFGEVEFGSDLRPLYWSNGKGPVKSKSHPDGGPCVVPYSNWSMNPYLAWKVVWMEIRPLISSGKHAAAVVTAWLRRRGFGHRSGLMSRTTQAAATKAGYPGPVPADAQPKYVSLRGSFEDGSIHDEPGMIYSDPESKGFWDARSRGTGRTGEVLDASFGGCHMSAALVQELLRAMAVPAQLSDCAFPSRQGTGNELAIASSPTGDLQALGFKALSKKPGSTQQIARDEPAVHHHASLVVWQCGQAWATFHNDTLLSWVGWRFADPVQPWLPLAEWLLFDATALQGPKTEMPKWARRLWAAHEAAISRSAIHGMSKRLEETVAADKAFDTKMLSQLGSQSVPPFATERAAWFRSLKRSLQAQRGKGTQDPLWVKEPATNAHAMRNALLKLESLMNKQAHGSAAWHEHKSMVEVIQAIADGPGDIANIATAPLSTPKRQKLRDAVAACMGCDTAALYGAVQPIPWLIQQGAAWQVGDLRKSNHCCDNHRWGQLPVNWWNELTAAGPQWLVDDEATLESFALVIWQVGDLLP